MQQKEILDLVIDRTRLAARVTQLAREVEIWRKGDPLVAVCILKGGFLFFADLVRQLKEPLQVEFMRAASYGQSTDSCGTVSLSLEVQSDLSDKRVLVVEDIVDTGLSMQVVLDHLRRRQPRDMALCTLISKTSRRASQVPIDFAGFEISDGFLVGYGLDYAERYRGLPDICELRFE